MSKNSLGHRERRLGIGSDASLGEASLGGRPRHPVWRRVGFAARP
ncbi:hypothetical protein [Streptomyces sp. CA2R101]